MKLIRKFGSLEEMKTWMRRRGKRYGLTFRWRAERQADGEWKAIIEPARKK